MASAERSQIIELFQRRRLDAVLLRAKVGVEFIDENGGGPDVWLRKPRKESPHK